jgi:endoglucanase
MGGTTASGGSGVTGGSTGVGGESNTGGSKANGGSTGAGGSTGVAGGSNTGGSKASGGWTGTGGLSGTGGTSGHAGLGGTTGLGGINGSGGSAVNGGSTSAGGISSGGTPGAGGSGVGPSKLPWLNVVGNQIQIESTGQQVILRGLSIEGLDQQSKDPKYDINGVIDLITNKNDTHGSSPGWYPVMLRLPVDQAKAMSEINTLLKPAVDYATKKGLYVIIDLHYVDNPYNHVQEVNNFWTAVAPMFKDYSNVFYEPFNESKVQDSWATYKPTMQAWVNLIRGFAPKNLIFAGSPSWDQTMGDAATNPLTGGNIAYVVHMYYHHYKSAWNRTQVEQCAKVHPVVMTEWGYDNSPGETETDPDISVTYGKPMLQWLDALGGSWTNWCASNSWLPKAFDNDWNLQVGPRQEGGFVKDWLYTNRNVKSPIPF